jgi:molybdopterin-guanine dinucleotide biosynthesis protein A
MLLNHPTSQDITGWVLAGGQGQRMGGVDKGLQSFQGQPFALTALERLRPQVNTVCINANRNLDDYLAWGFKVYPDMEQGFAGPLMGFLTGLHYCQTEWLMVVPCDSPFFPLNLVARLAEAAHSEQTSLAMVNAHEINKQGVLELRPQPVFCLLHKSLEVSLQRFLETGSRKIDNWTAQHPMAVVDFNSQNQSVLEFANFNAISDFPVNH